MEIILNLNYIFKDSSYTIIGIYLFIYLFIYLLKEFEFVLKHNYNNDRFLNLPKL